MKTLLCGCGKEILVDDEAFGLLSKLHWNCISADSVYTSFEGEAKALPRFIMAVPNGFVVDHINRNGHDNRLQNLRLATIQQNNYNTGPKSNSQTGYKGVHWCNTRKKWHAAIRIKGVKTNLGRFDDLEEAVIAYNEAAKKHHGKFAFVNKLPSENLFNKF